MSNGDTSHLEEGLINGFYQSAAKAKIKQMDDEKEPNAENESEGEDDNIFEVDYLMDMKYKRGVRHFYVRWKGYDETEDSWEPEENLEGARAIVDKFLEENKSKVGNKSKSKTGQAHKKSTTPLASLISKRQSNEDLEEKSDSNDEDYGQKRKRKKVTEEASTSKLRRPVVENYTSVPALNKCIKRRINTNLRWLEDESDENSDSDANRNQLILSPPVSIIAPTPVLTPILNSVEDSHEKKSKDKKKKKKSKKHSKDKERSNSPIERVNNNNTSSFPPHSNSKLTFIGVYRPDARSELQFIVQNSSTNARSTMTLAEAFLVDGWNLCTYLASKIKFLANGEPSVEINSDHSNENVKK